MKKNTMMRIASCLLIAVLMTTCVISGTFAKYVETGTATDTARVAKWGVTVAAQTDTAFETAYPSETDGYTSQTVIAAAKVVAPGTSGDLASLTISGTPEVAVEVSYTADLTLTGWEVDGNEYCPLIIGVKIGDTTTEYYIGATVDSTTISDTATLISAVEAAVAEHKNTFEANQAISDTTNLLSVSWEWEYESDTLGVNQTDDKDTALGDIAATSTAPTITLNITTTATQID